MSRVAYISIPHALLRKLDSRAAHLKIDRAQYVHRLIEKDLAANTPRWKREFASEDLIGSYTSPIPGDTATNARVREVMKPRNLRRRACNC
jgi:hypothetical protein